MPLYPRKGLRTKVLRLQEVIKIITIRALYELLRKYFKLTDINESEAIRDLFWARHLKSLSPLQGCHEF
ncbi:hypothetical protein D9M70_549120 [compost metagenome]